MQPFSFSISFFCIYWQDRQFDLFFPSYIPDHLFQGSISFFYHCACTIQYQYFIIQYSPNVLRIP